jgi:hypothetical protein
MTNKIRIADLPKFDPSEHLKDEEGTAAYLTAAQEENDPALLAAALWTLPAHAARVRSPRPPASPARRFSPACCWSIVRRHDD